MDEERQEQQQEEPYVVLLSAFKPEFRDFWMMILFMFNLCFSLSQVNHAARHWIPPSEFPKVFSRVSANWGSLVSMILSKDMFVVLGLNLFGSFLIFSLFVVVFFSVPKMLIRVSGCAIILASLAGCCGMLVYSDISEAGVRYILGGLALGPIPLVIYALRKLEYTGDLFKYSAFLVRRFFPVFFVCFLASVVLLIYSATMLMGIFTVSFSADPYSWHYFPMLGIYLIFSFGWTFDVILNIVRFIVSGFICRSFLSPDKYNYGDVTRLLLKQALLYNLGSMCFASLFHLVWMCFYSLYLLDLELLFFGDFAMVEISITGRSCLEVRRGSKIFLKQVYAFQMLKDGRIFLHFTLLGAFELAFGIGIAFLFWNIFELSLPFSCWIGSSLLFNFCLLCVFFATIRSAISAAIYAFHMEPGNFEGVVPQLYQHFVSIGTFYNEINRIPDLEEYFKTMAETFQQ